MPARSTGKPASKPAAKASTKPKGSSRTPAGPISSTPKSKDAQTRIADYVKLTARGKTFRILHRGKTVAVLAPPKGLPDGMEIEREVTTSEIAQGKRTFANVIHHGPYRITRHGETVAVAYAPRSSDEPTIRDVLDRMSGFMDALDQYGLAAQAMHDRLTLRLKADGMIKQRIEMLRNYGDPAKAAQLQAEFDELGRAI